VTYWNVLYPGVENKEKLSIRINKWHGVTQVEQGKPTTSTSKLTKYKIFVKYEDCDKIKEKMDQIAQLVEETQTFTQSPTVHLPLWDYGEGY